MPLSVRIWAPKHAEHHFSALTFDTESSVNSIKCVVAEKTGIAKEEIGLIHCGRKIEDDSKINDMIKTGRGSLFAMHLGQPPVVFAAPSEVSTNSMTANDIQRHSLLARWQTALSDTAHKNLLMSILTNNNTINNLISTTPGLKDDMLAQKLLRDPYLLMHWLADQDVVLSQLTQHSSILEAGEQILSSLYVEASRVHVVGGADAAAALGGDDDDEDEDDDPAAPAVLGDGAPSANARITHNQLAQAIARATVLTAANQPTAGPSAATADRPNTERQQSAGSVTTEMLQQAMQQAFGGGSGSANASGTAPATAGMEEQLGQLEAMGFSDRDENLRALTASGGNVEAALEFIVNQREQMEREMGLD